MIELNKQQKDAFEKLLSIMNQKGKQYVYTQGKNIEWFSIKEIETSPYYEIDYKQKGCIIVKLHTHENGYQQFVLKFHDEILKEGFITEETTKYFFEKEFEISYFIMECLNELFKIKKGGILGYISVDDDGCPLKEFRKNFIVNLK
jgi:hypothetical protein